MLSLKGRQAKMEISEEFIKVYIIPRSASLWFFFFQRAVPFAQQQQNLMPHAQRLTFITGKSEPIFLCCLNKAWVHSLATELCQGPFLLCHPGTEKSYTMPSCHLFWPLTSKSSCASSLDAKNAGTARLNYVQMLHHHLPSRYFHLSWSEKLNLMLITYYGKGFLGHSWKRLLLPPSFSAAGVALVTAQIITLERVVLFGYLETF